MFGPGRIVQMDDFRALTISSASKKASKSAQDKGQNALVAAFLAAVRKGGEPPISLDELAAVGEATIAIEEALRTGAPIRIGPHA